MSAEKDPLIDGISLIKDSLTKYVVSPLNAFGLGGFVFDIEGESSTIFTAEITDHYLENNNAVQDHIAIKPQKVKLQNYVGEVVYRLDNSTNTPLQKVVQKLTILNDYVPVLAAAAMQAKNALQGDTAVNLITNAVSLSNIQSTVSKTADYWGLIKSLIPPTTKQQQAYLFFKSLFEQKILVSLQTPFEFVTNMAIETITATQTEDSKYISDFSITLKKIRPVASASTKFNPDDYFGKAQVQAAPVANKGNTPMETVDLPATTEHITNIFIGKKQ